MSKIQSKQKESNNKKIRAEINEIETTTKTKPCKEQ
jgi:hypothetical protein